jgi:hypothetical protein
MLLVIFIKTVKELERNGKKESRIVKGPERYGERKSNSC